MEWTEQALRSARNIKRHAGNDELPMVCDASAGERKRRRPRRRDASRLRRVECGARKRGASKQSRKQDL